MLQRLFPPGSVQRKLLWGAGLYVVFHVLVFFLLPGQGGRRGTPLGALFSGGVFGALNALTAMGLILIYRTSRIINFAQAALGAVGAIFAYNFIVAFELPYGVAFVLGVLVAAGVGTVSELFLRKFFEAPRLVVTIVTIGLASLIGSQAVGAAGSLPFWGPGRGLDESLGLRDVKPLPNFDFRISGYPQPFEFAHLLAVGVTVLALLGIGAFFRFTRMGIAVRAASEDTGRAQLLGINVRLLSTIVWTMAGALAGMGLILQGTITTFALGGRGAPEVLIAALAAAVIARMRSLPVAVIAAVAIAMVQAAFGWSYADQGAVIDAALFAVIAVGLLVQRKALQRGEEVSSWEATEEVRPTPKEMLAVGEVRNWRLALIAVSAVAVLGLPFLTPVDWTNTLSLTFVIGIVLLSLVVLTGWAGQVSLGQFAFVAIGAVVGGALSSRLGVSFWLAIPAAAVVTGAIAIVVGLPALRIKGLFLGVVTFAFAVATRSLLFNERYFDWLLPTVIERPTLLLVDFEDERSMYYLTLAFLVLSVLAVVGLRKTRPGRVLIALRENESEIQSFGINVVRTKLAAFALAGFLAGVAGVLHAHHQRAVSPEAFTAQESIDVFVFAVIGGIGSISGALLGAGFRALESLIPQSDPILSFFFNKEVALLVLLFVVPGGLAAVFYGFRDQILRIMAQRRQMVVPSLFADYDPDALEHRLVPLAEPSAGIGLGALPHDQRYRLSSELYGLSPGGDGRPRRRAPDDSKALGAAAERASGEG